MLHRIAKDLNLSDDNATDAAVDFAVKQGWLEEFGGHSIRLTGTGRQL